MISRAMRMEKRLASVAVSVNCQYGRPKRLLELFADPERIFGGKHEGDAFADAAGDGFGDDVGRVAGHGAGVAEAEVDVVVAVNVGEMRAAWRICTKTGKAPAHLFIQFMGTPPRSEDWARR